MGCENRECVVLARLNRDPLLDVRLCEAVKLHMLVAALDLHAANISGDNVPLFAMIMFARHTSLTPKDLMRNHLNPVGDTAGLEQVSTASCLMDSWQWLQCVVNLNIVCRIPFKIFWSSALWVFLFKNCFCHRTASFIVNKLWGS